jgi:hypothetical protein
VRCVSGSREGRLPAAGSEGRVPSADGGVRCVWILEEGCELRRRRGCSELEAQKERRMSCALQPCSLAGRTGVHDDHQRPNNH